MNKTILQIIPAPENMYAIYSNYGCGEIEKKVISLALVAEADSKHIEPMVVHADNGIGTAYMPSFLEFVFKPDSLPVDGELFSTDIFMRDA